MAILPTREIERPFVHGIREIRIGIAPERREDAVAFYADVLGLEAWPTAHQIPGGIGMGAIRRGLRLEYRHDPTIDPLRRRLVVIVSSLATVIERLREREWPFVRYRGFGFLADSVIVSDPTGHRLELRQQQPL